MSASKAGLVFAYNDYSDDGRTKKYFLLGVGGNNYNVGTNNGEYFLSYYENVDLSALSGSYDSENPNGTHLSCFNNTKLSKPVAIVGSGMSVYVSISEKAKEENDKVKVVTIDIGNSVSTDKKTVEGSVLESPISFEIGEGANNDDKGFSDNLKTVLTRMTSIKGGLGAYGMVTKATGGEKSTENKYEVIYTNSGLLAAEDAE
jgi:hypothetical protein